MAKMWDNMPFQEQPVRHSLGFFMDLFRFYTLFVRLVALRELEQSSLFTERIRQMALTPSTMLPVGTVAPAFQLPDTDGKTVSLTDFTDASAIVVAFICNHCPFVKHIRDEFTRFGRDMQDAGVAVIAISSNDIASHPADGPQEMAEVKRQAGFTFPYLYDADQSVAAAYHAACTPDFFLFDRDLKLVYRGQFDDSRPSNGLPVTGHDLRQAVSCLLENKPLDFTQKPSIGCNIKWIPGKEPEYAK